MSASILVAYATRHGSTREVAEAVAATLRERGLEVDIQPMRNVRRLAGYRAIVLGAPLYMFRWHKDAIQFLSQHRGALTQQSPERSRVAIFALGPFTTGDEEEWRGSREQLDKELTRFPWLALMALEIFGGKFDPARLRFPHKLFMRQVPASDLRDWAAIQAWASNLAAHFSGPGSAQRG
ncbi:MAG: flavodoxin [Anaerolineae bacterium]|nr:flavodoxin [Anaerolineae bacterium]